MEQPPLAPLDTPMKLPDSAPLPVPILHKPVESPLHTPLLTPMDSPVPFYDSVLDNDPFPTPDDLANDPLMILLRESQPQTEFSFTMTLRNDANPFSKPLCYRISCKQIENPNL